MITACHTETEMSASQHKWKIRLYYFLISLPRSDSAGMLLHFTNIGSAIVRCDSHLSSWSNLNANILSSFSIPHPFSALLSHLSCLSRHMESKMWMLCPAFCFGFSIWCFGFFCWKGKIIQNIFVETLLKKKKRSNEQKERERNLLVLPLVA